MTPAALGLLLAAFSATLSAGFHALLKAGEDRLAFRTWSCLLCAACALPVAIWSGPLPRAQWGVVALFALFSAANMLVLNRSYQINDFSAAYPVARGISPLAMAVLGVVLLGDELSLTEICGIATITAGIVAMALGKEMGRAGWLAAILTGLTTIGYNLSTAHGMRMASEPLNFIAWLYVADGVLIPLAMFGMCRRGMAVRLRASFAYSWPSAPITLLSYTALAYALLLAPAGPVSAIRESSVLIGLALAAFMLKERLDRWRLGAGILIVAGAVMLVFS